MKIVGRLIPREGEITLLYQEGYFVKRSDTKAVVCHISRLRRLAEMSPCVTVEDSLSSPEWQQFVRLEGPQQ